MKVQKGMQADEFESAIKSVGNTVSAEEHRMPRLLDHVSEREVGSLPNGTATPGRKDHGDAQTYRETLTMNASRLIETS